MKRRNKIASILVALIIVMVSFPTDNIFALDLTSETDVAVPEKKIYSHATLDDQFANDRIIVVLNGEASAKLKIHDLLSFPEIDYKSITDLTQNTRRLLANGGKNSNYQHESCGDGDGLEIVCSRNYNQILSIELDTIGKENVLKAIKALELREDILYVGPDYTIFSTSANTPNDVLYADNQQDVANLIDLPEAWGIVTDASAVRVGIVDSGIDGSHPDLVNQVNIGLSRDFISGSAKEVSILTDPLGHGTHVAGIIGAQGNNTTGITGVCWDIDLISLRVVNQAGYGYSSHVVAAVDYANANNISILNMSIGWNMNEVELVPYYDTPINIAIANYYGLVVCAAGNEGDDIDETNVFPASYDLPNLISVANTTNQDALNTDYDEVIGKLVGSNYGKNSVHLAAPGTSILSCFPTNICTASCALGTDVNHISNGYHRMSGTSMAAPHVTGVAALILSLRPNLTAAEVKALILDNVDKVDDLSELCITGGRLNAYKAVRAATEAETFVADANNDGRSDVILSRNNNGKRQFKVFLGRADGSYYLPKTTNSTYDFSYSDPAYIGDFNGDGYTDMLVHWVNGIKRQLLVFAGKGDGTFNEGVNLSSTRNHLPNSYPSQFFVGDVNDDGKDDFIVHFRNGDGKRCALVYKGKSTAPYLSDAPTNALTSTNDYRPEDPVFVGDFNGDGRTDMLVHWARDNDFHKDKRAFVIYTGKSDGTFNTGANFTSSRYHKPETYPTKFFVTDVNGDGKDDFVVHFRDDDGKRCNLVYKGNSESPYLIDAKTNAIESTNTYVETDPVFVGDVNGDGYSDMVVHWVNNGIRQLMTYTAKADGKYNTAVKINTGDTHLGGRFFLADVNGDGRDDFIVKHIDELSGYMNIRIYLGTTSGGFGSGIDSVTGLTPFYDE